MRACLLAAGLATRLRPLTQSQPKQLLPLAGPYDNLLDYHLTRLIEIGVSEVVMNVSRFSEAIQQYVATRHYPLVVHFSEEGDTPCQTATGVARMRPILGDAPFLLISTDVWTTYPLATCLPRCPEWAHLVLTPADGAADFNVVAGQLTDKDPRYWFAGIAVCHPRLFTDLPPEPTGLGTVFRRQPMTRLSGEVYTGAWKNINTAADYHALNAKMQSVVDSGMMAVPE